MEKKRNDMNASARKIFHDVASWFSQDIMQAFCPLYSL
jgi:hypothetical protein